MMCLILSGAIICHFSALDHALSIAIIHGMVNPFYLSDMYMHVRTSVLYCIVLPKTSLPLIDWRRVGALRRPWGATERPWAHQRLQLLTAKQVCKLLYIHCAAMYVCTSSHFSLSSLISTKLLSKFWMKTRAVCPVCSLCSVCVCPLLLLWSPGLRYSDLFTYKVQSKNGSVNLLSFIMPRWAHASGVTSRRKSRPLPIEFLFSCDSPRGLLGQLLLPLTS